MSKLHVEVCTIEEVKNHPNADRLSLAVVKGFQIVIKKNEYKSGDIAIFLPPDAVIPPVLSDKYAFTQYLKSGGRVKPTNLRSEPSHGILIPNENNWPVGTDVAEHYGITKYIQPIRTMGAGGAGTFAEQDIEHPLFCKYTELDNLRHFPNVILESEDVSVTEKIHGTCCRVGLIEGTLMAGSRNHRRRYPQRPKTLNLFEKLKFWFRRTFLKQYKPPMEDNPEAAAANYYWYPLTLPNVRALLEVASINGAKQIILFGEVFGGNVQKGVRYGTPDKIAFRAFDLLIDGHYIDVNRFRNFCLLYGVDMVPELWRGNFSFAKVKELSEGKTLIGNDTHIREGVVIKPLIERRDPKVGRVILKYVSDSYLTAKDIGDFEDE